MDNKATKTEKHLLESFLAEAKAFTKYMIYSDKAQKEGYYQLSKLFRKISFHQKERAEIWLELLNSLGTTQENLYDCVKGSEYVSKKMYPYFEKIAQEEGFDKIAQKFREVCEIEKDNYNEYKKYLDDINDDKLYRKDYRTKWICLNCGHKHNDNSAPNSCPVCRYEKGYFIDMKYNLI